MLVHNHAPGLPHPPLSVHRRPGKEGPARPLLESSRHPLDPPPAPNHPPICQRSRSQSCKPTESTCASEVSALPSSDRKTAPHSHPKVDRSGTRAHGRVLPCTSGEPPGAKDGKRDLDGREARWAIGPRGSRDPVQTSVVFRMFQKGTHSEGAFSLSVPIWDCRG